MLQVVPYVNLIQPLPFKEPSGTLLNLLGILVNAGQRFASIAEINVGQGNPNAPVGTTSCLTRKINQSIVCYSQKTT